MDSETASAVSRISGRSIQRRDTPVFTFNKGVRNGGMTNSHEIGHALGLVHDGLDDRTYHPGTGSGDTGWGPILGAPFGKRVTQWSNGDYTGATSSQEDLDVITNSRKRFWISCR